MRIRSFLLRVVFYDGTVLYRSCDSWNEVVSYMKKDDVMSVLFARSSVFEYYGDDAFKRLFLEYENKG